MTDMFEYRFLFFLSFFIFFYLFILANAINDKISTQFNIFSLMLGLTQVIWSLFLMFFPVFDRKYPFSWERHSVVLILPSNLGQFLLYQTNYLITDNSTLTLRYQSKTCMVVCGIYRDILFDYLRAWLLRLGWN